MMLDVLNYGLDSKLDFDVYWVDAGWYGAPHEDEHYSNCGPNWYRYVGDWRVNTTTHPTGDLMPIANAVHNAAKNVVYSVTRTYAMNIGDATVIAVTPMWQTALYAAAGVMGALTVLSAVMWVLTAKRKRSED